MKDDREAAFLAYAKIEKSLELGLMEKSLLSKLMAYWKLARYRKEDYIQKSRGDLSRLMGVKDLRRITQAIGSLQDLGLIEVLNREESAARRLPLRIRLNQDAIDAFFQGDFFPETRKRDTPATAAHTLSQDSTRGGRTSTVDKNEEVLRARRAAEAEYMRKRKEDKRKNRELKDAS